MKEGPGDEVVERCILCTNSRNIKQKSFRRINLGKIYLVTKNVESSQKFSVVFT